MDGLNRKQRRAMAAAERKSKLQRATSLPQEKQVAPRVGDIMTLEWPEMTFAVKCIGIEPEWDQGTVNVRCVPLEDSILPVTLNFPAPLTEFSTDGGQAIRHHWQKLTYAFALPDPGQFPVLPVSPADRELMEYFIQTCQELAGYSVINGENKLHVTSNGTGDWKMEAHLPTKEAFAGTAVAFRQLHSNREEASFDKVKGRLFQAIKKLPQKEQEPAKTVVTLWAQARAALMNQTLDTLICRKATNAEGDKPFSFREVRPEELITTYNYGGTIHFGDHRQALVDLTKDPTHEKYYSYGCLLSIAGLSHLYFGFAALLEAAVGKGSRPPHKLTEADGDPGIP